MAEDVEGGRKLRAKERKKYIDHEIDEDDIDGKRSYSVEEKLQSESFNADLVQKLTGPEFNMEWMQRNGLVRPIVFYDKTGLGLRVPSENFKVSDVKQCVGSRRVLDVMDVNTQKALEMSMKDWVKYYESPTHDRLLNVISLEFCNTRLENYVESPTLVRQIDWVDRAWPRHLKDCQTDSTNLIERMKYPKVQKYCLMSVAGCYTDWHIDFGGTSVWYHILHGEKIFWLAPPSQKNMDKYVEWTLSAKQGDSFLGDSLEHCQRIQLKEGFTFIIPSGWIHAVYTPKDSLVFGGNFLHSFNIEEQLTVARIENKTYVPGKFRYPFYLEMMWYVLDRYLCCLAGKSFLSSVEKDEPEDDDQSDLAPSKGLIQVDEDSRPPSRNPDSRPPSRSMEDSSEAKVKAENGEEATNCSKSVKIELTRIDASLKHEEDGSKPPVKEKRVRKSMSDPSLDAGEPRKYTHLTHHELRGVAQLADYLTGLLALPASKRGVPREMGDPEAALKEIKQVLEEHKEDDQTLAMSGEPSIGWPESKKKQQKVQKLGYKTFKTTKTPKRNKDTQGIRRRRVRCKKCEACTRTECRECNFCKDMKKFGGLGKMKQTCKSRQCMAPELPNSSVCLICSLPGKTSPEDPEDMSRQIMECGICWEISHPACLKEKYENLDNEGNINEDLPNSWECSKCCNEGKQGQLKPRVKPGVSVRKIKTDDQRPSLDMESPDEESRGMTPVEGKLVVAKLERPAAALKANGGSTEPSSLDKLQSPVDSTLKKEMPLTEVKVKKESLVKKELPVSEVKVKKESSVSEVKVKKESLVSESGSGDAPRKIKTPTSQIQQGVKDVQRKQVKKEQPPEESPKAPRKRSLPLSNGRTNSLDLSPDPTPEGKRPKREGVKSIYKN